MEGTPPGGGWQPPSGNPPQWQPPPPPEWPHQPTGPQGPPTWPPQQHGGFGPQRESSGKAIASLILGICGLFVCPLILSVVALVLGYQARTEIRQSAGRLSGEGNAKAGIVLGWIGVVVGIIGIIVVIGLLAAGGFEDPGNDFNDDFSFVRAVLGL